MAVPASSEVVAPPLPRTRLIGRESERATARGFLLDDAVPLLTLSGPGGVGKTRLALAIAGDVGDAFADGIVWVDLAPLSEGSLVPGALASALGFAPAPDQPVADGLARFLRSRQTLLLLDNCEHVLAETGDLVALLLARCPALQVLATSRAPLRLQGEQTVPVDPLPLPAPNAVSFETLAQNESVRLFAARARAVRPTFRLDDANAATVAALCRALDGLPLAIELAAARSTLLSPEALLAQMTDRLRLLGGGARDLPARQQTIAATIAWSYGLLDAEAQALFRRLSVFAGGFTLEAAQAVAAAVPDAAVVGALESLLGHSLVRRDEGETEPRFTMLETIREFGREHLAPSGEAEAVRRRHAEHFLALAETVGAPMKDGADRKPGLLRLDADQDNLRAALAWAAEHGKDALLIRLTVALTMYWFFRGRLGEGRNWADRAAVAAKGSHIPPPLRADAVLAAAWLARFQGDHGLAETLGQEGLALFRALDDAVNAAEALELLGFVAEDRGEFRLAQARHEESLALLRLCDRPVRLATVMRHLGWTTYLAGDVAAGERGLEEALVACRRIGYQHLAALILSDLAMVVMERGEHARATDLLQDRLALTWDVWGQRHTIEQLAEVAAAGGEHERAARLFGAAEAFRDQMGATLVEGLQGLYEPYVSAARSSLGEAAFAAAWAEGRLLSLEAARAEAALVGRSPAPVSVVPPDPSPIAAGTGSADRPPAVGVDLTRREREVLTFLCQRLTDAEIGARLFLSSRTVSTHVRNILGKLGAANRREAAALAARHGLV